MLRRASASHEITLTEEQAATLKSIIANDQMLKALVQTQKGLDALNRLLGLVVRGPVKLAVQWNQTAISEWRKINSKAVAINHAAACRDIQFLLIDNSPNQEFFRELSLARDC